MIVNSDNVYEVVVTVSDGTTAVNQTVMVTVEDVENTFEARTTASITGTTGGEEDIFVFDVSSTLTAYTIGSFSVNIRMIR